MTKMTKTQVTELDAKSVKYAPSAYEKVIADLFKNKTTLGFIRVEEDFPGVNPAHVEYMLKKLRADRRFDTTIHATMGVCIRKLADAAEPVAEEASTTEASA